MKKIFTSLFFLFSIASFGQTCIPNSNSLEFDGLSSYVTMAPSQALEISDSLTIEAWIKATSWAPTSSEGTIVCKHGWSSGEEGFVLRAGGAGQLSFNIAGDSSGINVSWREVLSPANALQLNTWYHVAATFDGSELKLYINGILAGSRSFTGSIITTSNFNLQIGRLADVSQPFTRFWSGNIDEVRIWHRALSQTEIASGKDDHLNPLNASGLSGYWRLNEGTGTVINDLGTGSTTGNLINATWSTDVPFFSGPATPLITMNNGILLSSSPSGNQWNLNGIPILNETGSNYFPTQNGSYTVTVTDSQGCSATSLAFILTNVGFQDESLNKYFPKVIVDRKILKFDFYDVMSDEFELKLFNTEGKIILSKNKGDLTNQLNLDPIPAGIYFLYFRSDKRLFSQKIILNE